MWFVMLVDGTERGGPIPLVGVDEDEIEKPMMFDTEQKAQNAADSNGLGKHFGYEVYEWPYDMPGGKT